VSFFFLLGNSCLSHLFKLLHVLLEFMMHGCMLVTLGKAVVVTSLSSVSIRVSHKLYPRTMFTLRNYLVVIFY
jgi:hypothetical protein